MPVICNWNIYNIDTKLTLQASQKSHGPVSWYDSIDLDKLNNFCSRCLYKIFTRKKFLPSKNIDRKSTLQASHMSRGSNSWYRSIELDKLNNFCSMFQNILDKNLWCKMFSKIRRHGGFNFRVQVSFNVFQPRSMKLAP